MVRRVDLASPSAHRALMGRAPAAAPAAPLDGLWAGALWAVAL
eukprot:CAMPEP_0181224004 /NCGR_PEP_ID=MMETSP1096-20121128/30872_1 /TAXON_ID=156174 ORGANISM="Chrysochromulina ericina, Strain CCMP281" /NCGR_SAMPLE_ID=MMETSP1096 /ASSEMBLY_ACC=CAM_ASM_000453 /LENGTH=42 /DNA_ID= /DNA_START= /DNA_END= /DNA_ORIENTATION=